MHTLDELTTKLLHEGPRRNFMVKSRNTKTLWVKFCKMSTKKKQLHGGETQ
jgi:hypothetical protein